MYCIAMTAQTNCLVYNINNLVLIDVGRRLLASGKGHLAIEQDTNSLEQRAGRHRTK